MKQYTIAQDWKSVFSNPFAQYDNSNHLKQAALDNRLGDWTLYLTDAVVQVRQGPGFQLPLILSLFEHDVAESRTIFSLPGIFWIRPRR